MPCLSGNYDPAVGILLQVGILPASELTAIQAGQGVTPLQNLAMFMGLVDTGASVTCISNNVVKMVGLTPSGKTTMTGSTGSGTVDQFSFLVVFFVNPQQLPTGQVTGQAQVNLVQGCEFASHGFGFDVLIGRDILCKGALSFSYDGHFVLSF
ncbi:MAG TPA: aspartyl protease family protein [Xanthobacteraceae bacterium]|nr:aspartyl protease family protein [Xanthobacteraceae bacterium]